MASIVNKPKPAAHNKMGLLNRETSPCSTWPGALPPTKDFLHLFGQKPLPLLHAYIIDYPVSQPLFPPLKNFSPTINPISLTWESSDALLLSTTLLKIKTNFIHQNKCTTQLFQEFGMHSNNPSFALMHENLRLTKDIGSALVDATMYRKIVGHLNFLSNIISDIQYFVNRVARFMHQLQPEHLMAVKQILRYLKRTPNLESFIQKVALLLLKYT